LVTNWNEYTQYVAYAERFAQAQGVVKSSEHEQQEAPGKSGPPQGLNNISEKMMPHGTNNQHPLGPVAEWAENAEAEHNMRMNPSGNQEAWQNGQVDGSDEKAAMTKSSDEVQSPVLPAGDEKFPSLDSTVHFQPTNSEKNSQAGTRKTTFSSSIPVDAPNHQGSVKKRRRGTTKGSKGFSASDDLISRADAEGLLGMVQGHLVNFPYNWLHKEEHSSNWLYQVDQVAPLQI
jgi:phospholipase D1/2